MANVSRDPAGRWAALWRLNESNGPPEIKRKWPRDSFRFGHGRIPRESLFKVRCHTHTHRHRGESHGGRSKSFGRLQRCRLAHWHTRRMQQRQRSATKYGQRQKSCDVSKACSGPGRRWLVAAVSIFTATLRRLRQTKDHWTTSASAAATASSGKWLRLDKTKKKLSIQI